MVIAHEEPLMARLIGLTGATGLIGKELLKSLLKNGDQVLVIGRNPEPQFRSGFDLPVQYVQWSNQSETPKFGSVQFDAFVHLAGEPIAGGRWTPAFKRKLQLSRIAATENLVHAINASQKKCKVFISASAVGIYGNRADEILTESSSLSADFLGQLCQDWETQAKKVTCRSVQLRFGVVLARQGGALEKLLPVFKKGLGGVLAKGDQYMSVIHVEDVVRVIQFALDRADLSGPVNAVCQESVTNREFTRVLADTLNVPAWFKVPTFALKLALGEQSRILTDSQRVRPAVLQSLGFEFKYASVESALRNILRGAYPR